MSRALHNFITNPAMQDAMAADVAQYNARRANPRAMVGTPGRPYYGEQEPSANPMTGGGGGGGMGGMASLSAAPQPPPPGAQQLPGTPVPQAQQLPGTPVTQGQQLYGTPVPQGQQLYGTPVPQGQQLYGTPVPQADQLPVAPPGTAQPGPGALRVPGTSPTHAGLQCKDGTTVATGPWGPFCRNITTNLCPPESYPCGQTDTGTSTEIICCSLSHPQGGSQLAAPTPVPNPWPSRSRGRRNRWMPNGY